jgi:hypothetical protein
MGADVSEAGAARGDRDRRGPVLALGAAIVILSFALLFLALHELLAVPTPAAVEPVRPSRPALTSRLLLVLADGLRHDYAVDPDRMPSFSRHMREDAHAVLWAGRVTMTSAAVLTLSTGARGDFAQIISNVNAGRAKENDLFQNARAAGMRTGVVGDDTWISVFGKFEIDHTHSHDLALDADNSPEMLQATEKMVLEERPELSIAHFAVTDHLAHAFGTKDPRYRDVLRRFDQGLEGVLSRLPPDVTVIVISDHGMKDTGTHGADTKQERKSPLFAYGPGIRKGAALPDIDQVDLASTFAALLGIAGPTHGRGAAVTEMLDVTPAVAADIACEDAARVLRTARAEGEGDFVRGMEKTARDCDPSSPTAVRQAAGRAIVRAFDDQLTHSQGVSNRRGLYLSAASVAAFFLLSAGLFGRMLSRKLGAFTLGQAGWPLLLIALDVLLVWGVERITPPHHNYVRAFFYVACFVPLAAVIVLPRRAAEAFRRHPVIGLTLLPGALAWAFPVRAQMPALIVIAAIIFTWALSPHADLAAGGEERLSVRLRGAIRRLAHPVRLPVIVLGLVALFPFARHEDNQLPEIFGGDMSLLVVASLVVTAAWLVGGAWFRDRSPRPVMVALALALAVAAVTARRLVPSFIGVPCAFGFPLLAPLAARRGQATVAFSLLFASYALLARDADLLPVVAAAMVGEAASAMARSGDPSLDPDGLQRPWAIATLTALVFSLGFLARMGIQGGIDFPTIDWGAGTFGDRNPPALRIGLSIGWKYVAGELLVLWASLRALGPRLRFAVAMGIAMSWAGRAGALAVMLFTSRASFFTAYHCLGDLPSALLFATLSAVVACGIVMSRTALGMRGAGVAVSRLAVGCWPLAVSQKVRRAQGTARARGLQDGKAGQRERPRRRKCRT